MDVGAMKALDPNIETPLLMAERDDPKLRIQSAVRMERVALSRQVTYHLIQWLTGRALLASGIWPVGGPF